MSGLLPPGCPMSSSYKKPEPSTDGAGSQPQTASAASATAAAAEPDSCSQLNPLNNMQLQERQSPSVGQSRPLPTQRQQSSIPMSSFHPAHQASDAQRWEYPSQQMFYNAMKRKGWKPQEDDMPTILAIHNNVNETAWRAVLNWERLHPESADEVKLNRFMGRPKDLSPKAFVRSLLGQDRPFDRHDWFVQRGDREVRYVLDFYNVNRRKEDGSLEPVGIAIDARPALDHPLSVFERVRVGFQRIFGRQTTEAGELAFVNTAAAVHGSLRHPDATSSTQPQPS